MKERHTRKTCKLLSQPGYARYLKELKGGGLRVDRSKIRGEARLDGKTVIMTNELKLPAGELVQGYHDLWLAERAFRSMKSILANRSIIGQRSGSPPMSTFACSLNPWTNEREELPLMQAGC